MKRLGKSKLVERIYWVMNEELEYREIPDGLREEYQRIKDYAFSPEEGVQEYESEEDLPTDLGNKRGLFKDGELLCVCSYHDFETWVRSGHFRMGGVASVATLPEYRHMGLIRELMKQLLNEFLEEDIYISALWPFKFEFYRKYGWESSSDLAVYEFSPDAIDFVSGIEKKGEFTRVGPDGYEVLDEVYEGWREGLNLGVRRTEARWKESILKRGNNERYAYVWTDDDGKPRSYVIYQISSDSEGWESEKRMWVIDLCYLDHESLNQVLRFLYYHEAQIDEIKVYHPTGLPLRELVDEPNDVSYEIYRGGMFRLVDVRNAIEMIDYGSVDASFSIEVKDPLVERNDARFEIDIREGVVECRKTDREPDFVASVNDLSEIYVGDISPRECARLGKIEVKNEDKLDEFEHAFPEQEVFLTENF